MFLACGSSDDSSMIPKRPQATVKLLAAPACQRAHDSDLSPAPRCTSDLDARSGGHLYRRPETRLVQRGLLRSQQAFQ